ncbi:hypothetical protein ABTL46_22465, partial [Acinetobacter baumannii]
AQIFVPQTPWPAARELEGPYPPFPAHRWPGATVALLCAMIQHPEMPDRIPEPVQPRAKNGASI